MRLNGWKEIASHFGKSVRTVQRWERDLGLPVRRLHTAGGEIVFAHLHELEAWERRLEGVDRRADLEAAESNGDAPTPAGAVARPRKAWWVAGASVVVVGLAVTSWLWLAAPGQPTTWATEGNTLTIYGADGAELWSYRFPVALDPADFTPRVDERPHLVIDDLDGDGLNEVLVQTHGAITDNRLYVLNADGSLRFRTEPGRTRQFGEVRFEPPFGVARFLVAPDASGHKWVWVNLTHNTWFPAYLQKIGPDGHVEAEYWANGHQRCLGAAVLNGRPVILLGGTSNDLKRATLTVLDAENPSGSAPAKQAEFVCRDCPEGRPLAYVAFPETELTPLNEGFRPTVDMVTPLADGGLRVNVLVTTVAVPDGPYLPGAVFYTLDSSLRPTAASLEDDYRNLHSMLRLRGLLDHDLGAADEAQLWPVLSWTGERFEELRPPDAKQ